MTTPAFTDIAAALGGTPLPEYKFYNGEITVLYDDEEHSYTRYENSQLVLIPGVTTVCHIIDKSAALTQWAANMTVSYIREQLQKFGDSHEISPSTVESWLNDARFNFKDYKDKAADIGHFAHEWLERYIKASIKGDQQLMHLYLEAMPENEQARNGAIAALDWMNKHNVRWVTTERKIYSRKYDYAGTEDGCAWVDSCDDRTCCKFEFKDVLSVIDWKTSNRLYDEYRYQTAAYEQADEEEFGIDIRHRWINRLGKDDAKFESWHLTEEDFEMDLKSFIACLELYRLIEKRKDLDRAAKAEAKAIAKAEKERLKEVAKQEKAAAKLALKEQKERDKVLEKERKARFKVLVKQGMPENQARAEVWPTEAQEKFVEALVNPPTPVPFLHSAAETYLKAGGLQ